jgi:hypothetical protein
MIWQLYPGFVVEILKKLKGINMAKTEISSFENGIKQHGNFIKSTMSGLSMKKRKELNSATKQIIFGINRKQDNQIKTNQLNLFQ